MLTVSPPSIDADAGDANNLAWAFSSTPGGVRLPRRRRVADADLHGARHRRQRRLRRSDRHHHHHRHQRRAGHHASAPATAPPRRLAETNAALAVAGTLTVDRCRPLRQPSPPSVVVAWSTSGTTTGLGSNNAALAAMLAVTAGSIAANAGDANNLAWTFSSTPEAFDYLDDGESLTLTYTVRATDDSSAFDEQTVTITITGTNDAPVITRRRRRQRRRDAGRDQCRRCRHRGTLTVNRCRPLRQRHRRGGRRGRRPAPPPACGSNNAAARGDADA